MPKPKPEESAPTDQAEPEPKAAAPVALTQPATAEDVVAPTADEIDPPAGSKVVLRYNHYREEVQLGPVRSVSTRAVKDLFSFDYGFQGAYRVHLRAAGADSRPNNGDVESALHRGDGDRIEGLAVADPPAVYFVEVEEDSAEVARAAAAGPRRAYKAPSAVHSGNAATRDLTRQLKGLSADELKAQTSHYQSLVEARDLEDVLFSGDGVMDGLISREDDDDDAATAASGGGGDGAQPDGRDSPDSLDDEGKFDGSSDDDDDNT